MIVTEGNGSTFEQAPVGNHLARCVKIIDIGTQHGEYQGKPRSVRQVVIMWELPDELMSEGDFAGKPFIVSKWYTASLSEKANLRKDLECWRGRQFTAEELKGFDLKAILDKCCMLNVSLNEKNKAKVSTVSQLPKGITQSPRVNDLVLFSLSDFNQAVYDSLGEYWKKLIAATPEYALLKKPKQESGNGGKHFDKFEDDIPF